MDWRKQRGLEDGREIGRCSRCDMRIVEEDLVPIVADKHIVFAYYVTGHGFGHATRVVEVCDLLI